MLKHLHIQNYALIDSIDLDLSKGLSVITGETGAGKSILIGAISLLMGQRADSKTLFDPTKKCIIEGQFSLQNYPHLKEILEQSEVDFEEPCLIRREINAQGKSRSFVNDSPVTLDSLKKIGQELVDIHSQQDTWWMSNPDFSLDMVDSFAQNQLVKSTYLASFRLFQEAHTTFQTLERQASIGNQGLDFMKFQWAELEDAKLQTAEFEDLKTVVMKLENAEQIREKLSTLINILSISEISTSQQMRLALQQIQTLGKYGGEFEQWKTRLESIWIDLKDLTEEIEAESDEFQSDPHELALKIKRLDTYTRLMQKHQINTIEELISIKNKLDEQISGFENIDLALEKARLNLASTKSSSQQNALILRKTRMEVLDSITLALTNSLRSLGIPNATLDWEKQDKEVANNGADKIQLLFSANKGLTPKPFKQIASGGEMSRLMLSIKHLLAQKRALPTLILDEIDTGVSGEIAIQMGGMLAQMSQSHQIIAITHLPQIAAAGQNHWFVFKNHSGEKTVSSLRKLMGEERVAEIAKMIGGQKGYVDLMENVRKLIASTQIK